MRAQYETIKVVNALESIVVNDDTEGTGALVDFQGFRSKTLAVNVGASGDTLSGSVKLEFKVQHGDASDGSDLVAVPEDELDGAIADTTTGSISVIDSGTEDSVVLKAGYRGNKRYGKLLVDTTGTHTNGTPIGAVWILTDPLDAPVS